MGRRFRLNVDLTVPRQYEGGREPARPGMASGVKIADARFVERGAEVGEEELPGVNVDALVQGGFLQELEVEPVTCPACSADPDATKKAQNAKYGDLSVLRAHYEEAHPALAPPVTLEEA